ncbi:hypothetical protein EGH25_07240 [Haladaptatus sp. F3-133]|jgi:hypothetical protein|uniref:Uncharacterized protein n=1 Tax=Halorutilus salinus TaxID=2487751 RepID=A0A9Q4C4Y7_9EURY|nr:hypothetical protein [Halorutilus salinus]MCX2819145.1 hypothetical protein [Halorutilus salinus]
MTDEDAPIVPDVRGRNRRRENVEEAHVDGEGIREEMEALRDEAPFVPTVAKRREERIRDAVGADD